MSKSVNTSPLIEEAEAARDYGTTVLRAARHRYCASREVNAIALADELGKQPKVEVLALLDAEGRPSGIISRENLFALLGKPFGREVLGRTKAWELAENVPMLDSHSGLFSAGVGSGEAGRGGAGASPYRILVDAEGRFRAILSSRDLAEHLSRITEDDIELAGRIQERLEAGNEAIGGDGYRFEAWSRPAKGVGGDFWHSKRLEDGKAFIALCDVSGKGVAASLVVSLVWGMLRMNDFSKGLASLLVSLNEAIVATFHLEKYLTGFFCVFDPGSRELAVADMGHSHALILRAGGARRLKAPNSNLPIGVETELHPLIHVWHLRPGDALLVYSDGLTEQEDQGGAEFGEGRLAAVALKSLARGASLRDTLPLALDTHRGRTPQQDDMSFMLLSLLP